MTDYTKTFFDHYILQKTTHVETLSYEGVELIKKQVTSELGKTFDHNLLMNRFKVEYLTSFIRKKSSQQPLFFRVLILMRF